MRFKIGSYLRENILEILISTSVEPIVIKNGVSYDLKVSNFFDNLSIEDEKYLEQATGFIHSSFQSQRINEQETNIIIPDEQCSLQIIKLPIVSEKEIISAIELQSEEFVPYPIEKATFDYQILSIDKQKNSMYLLLVVALKDNIERVSNLLLNLGLYPTGLETETTALIRIILNKHLKFEDEYSMLINIGNRATQITILNSVQKQLVTTNSVNIGDLFFYKALQNNLNIPNNTAKEMFNNLKIEDLHYQKIIKPVFAEYAKQLQQILMSALEKIGTLPTRVYLYSSQVLSTYDSLFKDHPMLQQYKTVNLNTLTQDFIDIKFPDSLKDKLGYYLVSLGAII